MVTLQDFDLAFLIFSCLLFQSHWMCRSLYFSIQANSLWIRVPAKYLKCKMKNSGLQTGKSWWVARCWNTVFKCINARSRSEPLLHCEQINEWTPKKLFRLKFSMFGSSDITSVNTLSSMLWSAGWMMKWYYTFTAKSKSTSAAVDHFHPCLKNC